MQDSQVQIETVRQIFSEYLSSKGKRKTPERFAILDAVYLIDHHFDMKHLHELMLGDNRFHVSLATLYATIDLLLDAHLVIKHQFGGSSQYEKCYKKETHHHMICTQCGKVTEFQNETIRGAIESARLPRFTMSQYSLSVFGICSKCERKNRRKKK